MAKLDELKKAIEVLEPLDIPEVKKALSLIGDPAEEKPTVDELHTPNLGSKVKIVVLQRGWVAVGLYSRNATEAMLEKAATIRLWGTTKGLGELADDGPTSSTKLDKAGTIRFELLTTVLTIDVKDDAKWIAKLS